MDYFYHLQITFIHLFQSLGDWLILAMEFFTFLGKEEFYLLIMPAIYWCINPALGLRIGAMIMLSNGLNSFFKVLFRGPRPFWYDSGVRALANETSFGIPSGHAQNAASIWGLLAISVNKRWAVWAVAFFVLMIGLSRIYLAVHFVSDVLAGWLIGAVVLIGYLRLESVVIAKLRAMKLNQLILLSVVSTLVFLIILLLPILVFSSWQAPAEWQANAHAAFPELPFEPMAPTGIFTVAGTWFGLTLGASWFYRRTNGFHPAGPLGQQALRYLLGMAGTVLFWSGLKLAFPETMDALGYGLRFMRYAVVGVWVAALAPLLFLKLKLAKPA